MRAAVFKGRGRIVLQELPPPAISEGEAMIDVHYTGICGTDIFIYSGEHPRATPPLIMGHEIAGVIAGLDPKKNSGLDVGDPVVIRPTYSCGVCPTCGEGNGHVCGDLRLIGIDRPGGFAEYTTASLEQVCRVPDGLSLRIAALVEPVAVAVHAVRRSRLRTGDTVAVLGSGPIGVLLGFVARISGAGRVFVTDVVDYRLRIAREMGLEAVNAGEEDVLGYLAEETSGRMADVTFDAAGVDDTGRILTETTRIRGQIVVVSVFKSPPPVDFLALNFREQEIVGSRVYTGRDFHRALDVLGRHPELESLITRTAPLRQTKDQLEAVSGGGDFLKCMVSPER